MAAITYDLLLLLAVIFFVTIALNFMFSPQAVQDSQVLYPASLLICSYWYYAWQWVHGGQTLGMKAWRIMVIKNNATLLNWRAASIRYLLALLSILLFGLGLLWALFDSGKLTVYDRLTGTTLIKLGSTP